MMKTIILIAVLFSFCLCESWKEKIQTELSHYGSWSNILYSVAVEESTLNPYACNTNTLAHGLLQIRKIARDEYKRIYGVQFSAEEMYDYKINIRVAHGILFELYKLWDGDLYMALASYHAGRTRVLTEGVASHLYVKNILSRVSRLDLLVVSVDSQAPYSFPL